MQGYEAVADGFIFKPFSRVELAARVRSLLQIKALNDQRDKAEDVIHSPIRALALPNEALRLLGQAAMLRDIGRIGLPDRLLQKSRTLDEGERRTMQASAIAGERIMAPLRPAADHPPSL